LPFEVKIDTLLQDLIPVYLETRKKDIAQLKRWLTEGDKKSCVELIHKIKGSAGSYGLTKLTELCKQMESVMTSNSLTAIAPLLDEAEHYLNNLAISYVDEE
jgi:HPt (histidine-containing phosphotransfer) domain-containing protein